MLRLSGVKQRYLTLGLVAALMLFSAGTASAQTDVNPCPYTWTQGLKIGNKGISVLKLQQFLNMDQDTVVANAGVGSPGNENTSYGKLTAGAVAKFQEKYSADILVPAGLSKATGVVGALTRTKLNALCNAPASAKVSANTSATQTSSSTDSLTVSDPGQPASSLAPAGAGVLFTSITLTAGNKDVTVNAITARRVGMGADAAFSSIALYDPNGLQIGNIVSFDSNHTARFRQPFTIPANTSETLTIYGNTAGDLTDYAGQTPSIEVDSIEASSPVVGQLPLAGSPQTLNDSLVVGGAFADISQFDPGTSMNRYIGDTNVRFSGIRITANSKEDLTLSSIIWDQTGTASAGDISNVQTFVNGTSTPAVVSADGRTYVSVFNPGIVIPKGQSVDVYVRGDVNMTGANRTVEFDIYDNSDDVALTGNTYGFGVGIAPESDTAVSGNSVFITSDGTTGGSTGTPFYAGSIVTINGATINAIQKATN